MSDDITYPLQSLNGCTVEVWERISNSILRWIYHHIKKKMWKTFPCYDVIIFQFYKKQRCPLSSFQNTTGNVITYLVGKPSDIMHDITNPYHTLIHVVVEVSILGREFHSIIHGNYRQTSSISRTKYQHMLFVSSCSCLWLIHLS